MMSRWIDNFDSHVFRITWEDLKGKLDESEADNTIPTDVQELARLKKVVAFLDNALENLDPELFPTTLLDSYNQQATECRNQINNFNSNRNISHITNANKNVDNLLTYIRPYMIHEGSMKKTLLASVRAYNTEMEKSIEKFNEIVIEKLEEIETSKGKIDIYEAETKHEFEIVEEARTKIDAYETVLLGNPEDDTSIKEKFEELKKSFEDKHEKLQELYNEAFEDNEEDDTVSIRTALKKAKTGLEEDAGDAHQRLEDIKSEIKDFDIFYDKIFGKLNDEDTRENGLESNLDKRLVQLDEYEEIQNTKHTTLFEKIETLIPGATSAGLASAYKEMKESFDNPIDKWNKFFLGSVGVMFFVTFLSFVNITGGLADFTFSFANAKGIEETFESLFNKLPIYAPLIWLAIFSSKRRSEAQRLQQEYAHKEALAKSYDSYKTQIEQLEQEDSKMLLKLIESSIDTIAYNASETLDGKHGDSTPLQETVKQVTDSHKMFGSK